MSDWRDEDYISFDFETSGKLPEYGLQPWRLRTGEAWITSLAWVYRENGETKSGGTVDPDPLYIACFLAWAIESGRTLVGWNVQFDIQWLLALGLDNHVHQCRFVDGMLVWRHLEIEPEYETTRVSKKSYSLKTAVREHLPQYAGYEDQIDFHSTDPADRVKLHTYNIQDCLFTLRITKKLYNQLKARQRQAMWIEAQCLAMVAKANVEGMLLDTTYAQWLSKVNRDVAAKKLALLAPHGVTEAVVRSPKQLQVLMYDVWKLPVLKETTSAKTGTVSRSTDKTVLHELAFIDVRAKELRAYREALNNDTKFAVTPIRSVQYCGDGMSHPNARVFGTYSGRMTYSSKQGKGVTERPTGFALHQMPRMSEKQPLDFRAQVIAPKGYTIVEFDAAGQEFRWMAMAANDLTMLQLCQPGEDAHSFMGAKIARMDYKEFLRRLALKEQHIKDGRQLGKIANLSLQYRTSAKKLRVVARVDYDVPMSMTDAYFIHDLYRTTYWRVPEYWDRQIALTIRRQWVVTFAGRRVQVKGDWNGKNGWSMGSTAINYRIQGTGADQKYLAMMMMRDYIHTIGARFFLDLHDGIYLLVPDRLAKSAAKHIKKELDNLPYAQTWNFIPPVPLPWDCKMGKTWGGLKEFKP